MSITLDAERWSYVMGAIRHTLGCEGAGYELRYGGSELRDALTEMEQSVVGDA